MERGESLTSIYLHRMMNASNYIYIEDYIIIYIEDYIINVYDFFLDGSPRD